MAELDGAGGAEPVPDTSFEENFEFLGSELTIKQDTSVGHDAVLWDAARVLAKFFEVAPIEWRGRKVLDLGSGCGLTGICLATQGAKVTVTELPGKTKVLKDNVAANLEEGAHCEVVECVWGKPGEDTPWGPVTDMGEGWDYIVGSDLVYSDESTPALLETFLRSCGATTEIIMSMELRRKEDLDFFKRLVEVGFLFEKVPKEKCHPVYSADEIGVFRIRRKTKEGLGCINE